MISQLQILSKILNTKDFSIVSSNNLTEEYFDSYKNEFNFIKNHVYVNGNVPDKLTFLATFPEFNIQDVTEPDSYILEQLFNDYNTAFLAKRFNNIKKLLESNKSNEAIEYFLKSADNLRRGGAVSCVDLTKNTERYTHYREMQANIDKYFISTGFKELDKAIYGIDMLNENMVIVARTGQGKTWTLLKMAVTASLQNKTVGIYSGEMTADKVGYRIDTLLSGISNKAITHGNLEAMQVYKNYIDDLPNRNIGSIKVLTPNMISGPATVDALEAFIEKEHIDILFIDQYSLLEDNSTNKALPMYEKVANISKAVKRLQVKKQIPIISVAQMNRTKNEDKDGNKVQDTTQIGLSDRIGQDATCVLMLDRNQVKDKMNPNAPVQDQLIINVTKNRDGGAGKLTYAADFNTGEFIFIPENLDAEAAKAERDEYEGEPVI